MNIEKTHISIVAEIASAHEGRMDTLLQMVDVAVDAGCDYIKFQMFRAKEIVAKDHPKYDNYHVKEYSEDEWISISKYCESKSIPIIAEIFDVQSLWIAQKMNIAGYKVHSSAISDTVLLENIAKENKLFLLSAGGSTKEEIQKGINVLRKNGQEHIILMHGYQNFPTQLEDINLHKIDSLHKEFNLPVGIQEHVDGEDSMARITPLLAIAKGAILIEKHFTLDRSLKESDYYSSLNPDELKDFVNLVRQTELVFGSASFELSENEMKYRNLLKKSLYTLKEIKQGEKFSLDNICFKRSLEEDRILVDQIEHIFQKTAKTDIDANTRLTWEYVKK